MPRNKASRRAVIRSQDEGGNEPKKETYTDDIEKGIVIEERYTGEDNIKRVISDEEEEDEETKPQSHSVINNDYFDVSNVMQTITPSSPSSLNKLKSPSLIKSPITRLVDTSPKEETPKVIKIKTPVASPRVAVVTPHRSPRVTIHPKSPRSATSSPKKPAVESPKKEEVKIPPKASAPIGRRPKNKKKKDKVLRISKPLTEVINNVKPIKTPKASEYNSELKRKEEQEGTRSRERSPEIQVKTPARERSERPLSPRVATPSVNIRDKSNSPGKIYTKLTSPEEATTSSGAASKPVTPKREEPERSEIQEGNIFPVHKKRRSPLAVISDIISPNRKIHKEDNITPSRVIDPDSSRRPSSVNNTPSRTSVQTRPSSLSPSTQTSRSRLPNITENSRIDLSPDLKSRTPARTPSPRFLRSPSTRSPRVLGSPQVAGSPSRGSVREDIINVTPNIGDILTSNGVTYVYTNDGWVRKPNESISMPISPRAIAPPKRARDRFMKGIPDYSLLTDEQRVYVRTRFDVKFDMLRETHPQYHIPGLPLDMPLEHVHIKYNHYVKHIYARINAESYALWMIGGWFVMEIVAVKILGLPAGKFTIFRMNRMGKYKMLLLQLGEKYHGEFGEGWPVEVRIIVMSLVEMAIFIGIRYFASFIDEGSVENVTNMISDVVDRFFSITGSGNGGGAGSVPLPRSPNVNQIEEDRFEPPVSIPVPDIPDPADDISEITSWLPMATNMLGLNNATQRQQDTGSSSRATVATPRVDTRIQKRLNRRKRNTNSLVSEDPSEYEAPPFDF
jgi:hypothetical protein